MNETEVPATWELANPVLTEEPDGWTLSTFNWVAPFTEDTPSQECAMQSPAFDFGCSEQDWVGQVANLSPPTTASMSALRLFGVSVASEAPRYSAVPPRS